MKLPPDAEKFLNQFLEHARREMFPKMEASACVMSIAGDKVDAKFALELGAAILFGKPLIVLAEKGKVIDPRLKMIADEWIEYENIRNPETQAKLTAAIHRMMRKVDAKRKP